MRIAGTVIGYLILAAGVAAAADDETTVVAADDKTTVVVASGAQSGTGATGAATPATLDIDRFVALHMRLLDLENRAKHPDPVAEDMMWTAFCAVGLALAVVWIVGKWVETKDSERQARLAIFKELVQAKGPASTNADPQAALNEFRIRLEFVGGQIRFAEQALREADVRLNALSPAVAELEKKIQAAVAAVDKKP